MHIAGGIVTQKPIGIVSNNPNFAQKAQQREAGKQAQVDALVNKLAAQHQAKTQAESPDQSQKRWTVKF